MRISLPLFRQLAFLLVISAGLASCATAQGEVVARTPEGILVKKLTGVGEPHAPPAPGTFTEPQLFNSLRRITVRYHNVISVLLGDPVPLLTEAQAKSLAGVLTAQLPALAPDQRLRVRFYEATQDLLCEMDVYWDAPFVVYNFNSFVINPSFTPGPGERMRSRANIQPLPGQQVTADYPVVVVKDAPAAGVNDPAAIAAAKLAMLSAARAKDVVDSADEPRLRGLVQEKPDITVDAWRQYLEKRDTLKRARDQGLMDAAAYRVQLSKIDHELAP